MLLGQAWARHCSKGLQVASKLEAFVLRMCIAFLWSTKALGSTERCAVGRVWARPGGSADLSRLGQIEILVAFLDASPGGAGRERGQQPMGQGATPIGQNSPDGGVLSHPQGAGLMLRCWEPKVSGNCPWRMPRAKPGGQAVRTWDSSVPANPSSSPFCRQGN